MLIVSTISALVMLGGYERILGSNNESPSKESQIVLLSDRDGNMIVYGINTDGSDQRRLTETDAKEEHLAWPPDGTQLAFRSRRDGNGEIYVMEADGSNQRRLTDDSALDAMPTWSADGSQIALE